MLHLDLSLSLDEILFAAVLGLIITWIVQNIRGFKSFLNGTTLNFGRNPEDISHITQRCYTMFPIDKLLFKGETFIRGTKIRVTTMQKKIFEGELIGVNHRNMFCIITSRYIIAHEISNIKEISICSDK